jgi:hypothetical protein
MEIVIKINTDNVAFDPMHFDDTMKKLFDFSAKELSSSIVDGKFVGMRSTLMDPNGNKCGYVEMIKDSASINKGRSFDRPYWYDVADLYDESSGGNIDLGE